MNPAFSSPSSADRSPKIEDQAAAWLARRYGGLSKDDSVAFDAWLAEDPRHAAAIARLEQAWRVISSPATSGQGPVAQERMRARDEFRTRRRRQANLAMAGLALTAIVVAGFLLSPTWRPSRETPDHGIVLRPDLQSLPDGSTVQLNAGAEITLAFTADTRVVRLLRGEALFEVARDANRPFIVSAGDVDVHALGTAFTVRYTTENVDILVTQGSVAVARNPNATPNAMATPSSTVSAPASSSTSVEPLQLTAGQRTVVARVPDVAAPPVSHMTSSEIASALAWRDRRIEFTHTALSEAVERFNGQNRIQIAVADAKTGRFEISGIFWANDPSSFVRLLETAFEMQVERSGDQVIVRRR